MKENNVKQNSKPIDDGKGKSSPSNQKPLNNKELNDIKKLVTKANNKGFKPKRVKGHNAFSWYDAYPDLINQAGMIAFNNVAGEEEVGSNTRKLFQKVPGTLGISYLQTPGMASKWSDPVNLQMKALWLDLHRKYRGIGSYESSDLAMAMFAICDYFSQIAEAERMYGTLVKYSTLNRNEPKTLLMAERFQLDLTGNEIASFRANLNLLIAASNTLCLPKGIRLFEALIERPAGIYADADNIKASRYLFLTPYYVVYEPTLLTTGTALRWKSKSYQNSITTEFGYYSYERPNDVISRLQEQLNALLNDSDVQRMCSDLLACYGDQAVHKLDYITENAEITIRKLDEITLQLHNATFVGNDIVLSHLPSTIRTELISSTPYLNTPICYQYNNVVHFQIGVNPDGMSWGTHINIGTSPGDYVVAADSTSPVNSDVAYLDRAFLDTWKDGQPTVEEITEMSRLTVLPKIISVTSSALSSGGGIYVDLIHSIFVPLTMNFYNNVTTNDSNSPFELPRNQASAIAMTDSNAGSYIYAYANAFKYDWAPFIYVAFDNFTNPGTKLIFASATSFTVNRLMTKDNIAYGVLGDICNIKAVDFVTLERLHNVCSMSLWKVDTSTFSINA